MSIIDSETERHTRMHTYLCVSVCVCITFLKKSLFLSHHPLFSEPFAVEEVGDEIQFMPVIVFSITASLVCTLSRTIYSEMMH